MTYNSLIVETIEFIVDTCQVNDCDCANCEFAALCEVLSTGGKPSELKYNG